ncbi:DUF5683 domain-containing protein [Aquimarina hainanensis]|uniref:DUF5683 domain-containing protein n=1 Tax=Aquimarina hainanensis TaxID=1578017 RepID=A0ABW5N2W4_9FLAO
MKNKSLYIILFFFIGTLHYTWAQEKNDEVKIKTEKVAVKKKKNNIKPYEPLAPAKAAFYSAIVPGLGQAYTKKYWKIPIVYAAIGTGVYFYTENTNQYNRFRDAYKRRITGIPDEEFKDFSDDQLISIQRRYRREQELSLLVTVGLYLLNIVDANVTAHLQNYNISEDLTLQPKINIDRFNTSPNYGLSFSYSF